MPPNDLAFLLRNLTLRQMEIFDAVVRYASFTRAAEAVHLTQPSVSMQVRKLAETFGQPLFEQVGKKIFLTPAGETVHACCREIFTGLDMARMKLADLAGLKQGRLRLAVVTTAEYFAPRVLGEFNRRYPDIEAELVVVNRKQALARIADNLDDLYILGQPPGGLDVESVPFLENPHVPLAASDHPLAGRENIPLERLAREPFILREQGSGTRKATERFFRRHGLKVTVRMELGGTEAIKQAVAGGLGVTVLSAHTLGFAGASGLLSVLDVQGFPIERNWHLVHARGKELSPVARAFRDFVLEKASELMPLLRDPALPRRTDSLLPDSSVPPDKKSGRPALERPL